MNDPNYKLLEYLESHPLPWLSYNSAAQRLEFVVDNHLLSTYRACPQYFMYKHVEGLHRKAKGGQSRNPWFLDFGIWIHRMIERYYKVFRNSDFNLVDWSTVKGLKLWQEMDLDFHKEHKEYISLRGIYGGVAILAGYAKRFRVENEKFRILAAEVSFGKNREVPLFEGSQVAIYLSGRMDLLVDDGYFIMPMDHKTKGYFPKDPFRTYEVEEGPTGYVFALNKILPQFAPPEMILARNCNRILMNLISKKETEDPMERFKRMPLYKSTDQLEAYQQRQISTVYNLLADLERYIQGFGVQRDTGLCSNWMHNECPYFDIDTQASATGVSNTIQNGYIKLPIWDTETIGQE